jgi:anti-sigma factor RsiW
MNTDNHHIPFHQLVDLVEDRLTPGERKQLEKHLAACTRCGNETAQLRRLIELMRSDMSEDAPPDVIARAIRLYSLRNKPSSALTGSRRHVFIVPRFDSLGLAPAFGVRSGEPGTRQLLLSAVTYDTDLRLLEIDLRIESAGQMWIVSGQVLGRTPGDGQAELQSPIGSKVAAFNQQSEFILPPVQAGEYKLILHLANVDLELKDLKLGI